MKKQSNLILTLNPSAICTTWYSIPAAASPDQCHRPHGFLCQAAERQCAVPVRILHISCKKFEGCCIMAKASTILEKALLCYRAGPGDWVGSDIKVDEGWALFIHPDLLHGTGLGKKMHQYSFFNYEVNEALHILRKKVRSLRIVSIRLPGNTNSLSISIPKA